MSEFDSFSSHQVRQGSMPATNPSGASWRQVFKTAMEQSTWMRFRRGPGPRPSSGRLHPALQSFSNRKALLVSLFFALLGSLIVFGIVRYVTSPSVVKKTPAVVATGKSLLGFSGPAKPKPAPGKPFVPAPQQHLPLPTVWTQTAPTQQAPQTAVIPQQMPQTPMTASAPAPLAGAPPQPLAPARSSFTPLIYQARHDKHFGGSCDGQLTLSTAGLAFRCADDPGGSVQVPLNQIGAVDENGIELLSGKKYHFSIPGMTKNAEQQLFTNWLHQVR